ncbi:hypothetical protein J6590_000654 [Homalodisca vitripennis]|nr:hypothetical protein J6590_000654 [Homalodisca vitripennis]
MSPSFNSTIKMTRFSITSQRAWWAERRTPLKLVTIGCFVLFQQQRVAVLLAAMIAMASCQPVSVPQPKRVIAEEAEENAVVEGRAKIHHKHIIISQLLPFLTTAFINAITAVLVNWFYPWKVISPLPGKLGVSQLFGLPPSRVLHGLQQRSISQPLKDL